MIQGVKKNIRASKSEEEYRVVKSIAMWTGWTGGGQQEKIRCPLLKPRDTKALRAEVDRWTAKT